MARLTGLNDNDIVIETDDVSRFDVFMVSHAGTSAVADVDAYDGQQWLPALTMMPLGAASAIPVLETVTLKQFGFSGTYRKIRVRQKGANTVETPVLRARTGVR